MKICPPQEPELGSTYDKFEVQEFYLYRVYCIPFWDGMIYHDLFVQVGVVEVTDAGVGVVAMVTTDHTMMTEGETEVCHSATAKPQLSNPLFTISKALCIIQICLIFVLWCIVCQRYHLYLNIINLFFVEICCCFLIFFNWNLL